MFAIYNIQINMCYLRMEHICNYMDSILHRFYQELWCNFTDIYPCMCSYMYTKYVFVCNCHSTNLHKAYSDTVSM